MTRPTRLADADVLNAFLADNEFALVEFYTAGCAMCAAMEPVLGNVARALNDDGVAVGLVNPRDDPPLVERFAVTSVPALVLFRDGQEVARRAEGFQGAEAVVEFVVDHAPVEA
jgi:thioredoxin-like negative regulator of GroEL